MEKQFINSLKEAFEIEDREISVEDNFRDYPEWDSLSRLSLIAMLDEEYGVQIEEGDFEKLATVKDLMEEVKKRSS